MKIMIAPAKKMRNDIDYLEARQQPVFFRDAKKIIKQLKTLSIDEIRNTLRCSESIAKQAFLLYRVFDEKEKGIPSLLAYDGIQYTYMSPHIFPDEYYDYVEEHLRILSGCYGILKPMDGVQPYRLELDNAIPRAGYRNLYAYWGRRIYQQLTKDDHEILDLASRQYSRIITRYLSAKDHYVRCYFMEEEAGTYREKGVYVKMARGEMVRYLAEIHAQHVEDAKGFQRLHYHYRADLSDASHYVFTRKMSQAI